MPAAPPDFEPHFLTAGETVSWTRTLPEHPASTWTLKYAFQRPGLANIALTGTANGVQHVIAATAAASAAWAPGAYMVTGFVEDGLGSREVIGRWTISILPSPLAAFGSTHATRTLAMIELAIEGRVPNGFETTNIDGQELSRIPLEQLVLLRGRYQQFVASEQNAAEIRAGLRNRRNSFARFTRTR